MNFFSQESWLMRCASHILPATKSDVQKLEIQIMALKDDIKTGVARLLADNDKLLTAIQNAATGDGLTATEAQDLLTQINAASDKDEAALGGTAGS